MTASCPVVYGRALLSARSANVSSPLLKMPQIKKSRNAPASESSGSVQAGAAVTEDPDPPVPREEEESLAAGDARGEGDDNVGDSEIIKSPSDPKQYR